MTNETTVVTSALIEAGCTGNGGWKRDQLALIGVAWPPAKGWKSRAIGRRISREDADRFVAFALPTDQAKVDEERVSFPVWLLRLSLRNKWKLRGQPKVRRQVHELVAALRVLEAWR